MPENDTDRIHRATVLVVSTLMRSASELIECLNMPASEHRNFKMGRAVVELESALKLTKQHLQGTPAPAATSVEPPRCDPSLDVPQSPKLDG